MTILEAAQSDLATQMKQQLEAAAVALWLDQLDPTTLCQFDNPWSLHELASKTQFRDTTDIAASLEDGHINCDDCRVQCLELVQSKQHMPPDVFSEENCCLLTWKQAMRAEHDAYLPVGPQLDYTITLLKPNRDPRTEETLRRVVGSSAVIASVELTLTEADTAFLYTSAHGHDFTSTLMDYMTSGPTRALLIHSPDIGARQNELKKQVRDELPYTGPLCNNIHVPDSFHESLAQAVYFFPEESSIYVRT